MGGFYIDIIPVTEQEVKENFSDQKKEIEFLKKSVYSNSREQLNIGKDWHAMYFLLTGSDKGIDSLQGTAVLGPKGKNIESLFDEITRITLVNQILDVDKVKEVAKSLHDLSKETLLSRCEPKALKTIEMLYYYADYGIADQEYHIELKDDLKELFPRIEKLRTIYDLASKKNMSMLISFSAG